MSDDQNDDETPDENPRGLRQKLVEAERRAAEAEAKAKAVESREVFRDAGIDFTNKQHQAFVKAYDGELTADAVQNYVTDLGLTQTSAAPTEPPGAGDDEQAALIRIAEAARDSGAPPPSPTRREQLQKDLEAAIKRKAPPSEVNHLAREMSRAGGHKVREDYE